MKRINDHIRAVGLPPARDAGKASHFCFRSSLRSPRVRAGVATIIALAGAVALAAALAVAPARAAHAEAGGNDIDIRGQDLSGNVVASDTLSDGHPACDWYVPTMQTYRITVINRPPMAALYNIYTN